MSITDEFIEENLQKIKLEIEPEEKDVSIKEIRIGSDSNRIMIILAQTGNPYNIMIWDVKYNYENGVTDANDPFEIIWDYKGDAYIV